MIIGAEKNQLGHPFQNPSELTIIFNGCQLNIFKCFKFKR